MQHGAQAWLIIVLPGPPNSNYLVGYPGISATLVSEELDKAEKQRLGQLRG